MLKIDKIIYDRDELLKKIQLILSDPKKFKITNEIKFLSIVIEGKWGTGKTTFVNQIKELYEKENCVYFDAWKFDFLNDPFSSLTNLIANKKKGKFKKQLNKCVKKIKRFLPNALSIELFTLAKFKFEWNENNKLQKDSHDIGEEIENFQKKVNKLLEKPLLIIIDELDRCKPSFAINLIEIVKHLFNMENIIIIFSLNWTQLHDSLHSEYGLLNNKEEFYMDKIVDWNFSLPKLDNEKYLKDLMQKHCEILNNKDNINIFINWIIKTQKIYTLRDVVKKFSKWYLNWQSRVIKTGKENFDLCIERIMFSFLNNGSEELNYSNVKTLINQPLPWDKLKVLITEIDNFDILAIENNTNDVDILNEVKTLKNIFKNVSLTILTISSDYDLSRNNLDNLFKVIKKNSFYKFVLNCDIESMTIRRTEYDPEQHAMRHIDCISKEYFDYFSENINILKKIVLEIKSIPQNISLLINDLLKN